jgi:putative peptidoglycan lipid II flippase
LTESPADRRKRQGRVIGVASVIWATSIFISGIMGLAREQVIGRTLGASREADLYFVSFTLPDFLNYLLAAGALSIVFIPIFLSHCQRGDEAGADGAPSASSPISWRLGDSWASPR